MLGKSLPTVTPQHGLPFLGERSGSRFWKGQGEEGLVQEIWGQSLFILNKPKLHKLHEQPGSETLQTQWKAEGDRTSGRTGSLPRQTDTAPEGASHLCANLSMGSLLLAVD